MTGKWAKATRGPWGEAITIPPNDWVIVEASPEVPKWVTATARDVHMTFDARNFHAEPLFTDRPRLITETVTFTEPAGMPAELFVSTNRPPGAAPVESQGKAA